MNFSVTGFPKIVHFFLFYSHSLSVELWGLVWLVGWLIWATSRGVQGSFMSLYSEITPGRQYTFPQKVCICGRGPQIIQNI